MSLTGTPLLIGTLVAVLLTAVLIAVSWERGGRLRVVLRGVGVLAALLSVSAAALVQVNRMTEAFTLESASQPVPPAGSSPDAAEPDVEADADNARKAKTGSQIRKVTVPGKVSKLDLVMYVYLPAAYRTGKQRFPVVQAQHGFAGTPRTWLKKLQVQSALDTEIAAGRMAPTVVLFPFQTPNPTTLDTECTNLVGGPQTETFLTVDVPAYVKSKFRVRTDRAGWGLIGYSAGAYCATSLALRHPTKYAAAASLSGLAEPGITVGDGLEKTEHHVVWRLQNLPQPPVALWVGWANDETTIRRDSERIARAARPPLTVTTAVLERGGHSHAVWRQMLGPAFDWLSSHLGRPLS
ncbi:alpha/beta hydrolase [Couchioplanes caeruleus]|uniref:Esterase n=2 Tax=Couchioplanes caeruleus TaxID=56438 RepID=A0A1K0FPZ4_9ACTN|nr:alpha/beta hydrolase-fold protein [Couchioplanes caeruleus]OJF14865.1 esterase [Couchioplanes caeruleus subsp. caeruleus]ROP32161.1 S-formylglutathione hydrolase FrmB [Couchioplanes caeruleus]